MSLDLSNSPFVTNRATKLFWFLGVFLAKTLQDNRLVDMPLSYPFLKLLCQGEVSALVKEKSHIVQAGMQTQHSQVRLITVPYEYEHAQASKFPTTVELKSWLLEFKVVVGKICCEIVTGIW